MGQLRHPDCSFWHILADAGVGISLNIYTIAALILILGVVVDDAILSASTYIPISSRVILV